MIVLGIDVPLVELAFASIIIIIVILLEIIIIALLAYRQLSLAAPFSLPSSLGRFTSLPARIPIKTAKSSKPTPAKRVSPPPQKPVTIPLASSSKLKLEQELARVQEKLSGLPLYAPKPAVIKTELPPPKPSAGPDSQRQVQPIKTANWLLQKIKGGQPHPSPPEEARAYQEVQRIAKKVEAQKPAPKSELGRLDEEIAKLQEELKQGALVLKPKKA